MKIKKIACSKVLRRFRNHLSQTRSYILWTVDTFIQLYSLRTSLVIQLHTCTKSQTAIRRTHCTASQFKS